MQLLILSSKEREIQKAKNPFDFWRHAKQLAKGTAILGVGGTFAYFGLRQTISSERSDQGESQDLAPKDQGNRFALDVGALTATLRNELGVSLYYYPLSRPNLPKL